MGILDDVVVNAKSAAEAVSKKAGQLMDASKLRISAAELNAKIGEGYEALGQYAYENCRALFAGDPEAVGKMAELDELKAQAAAIAKELNDKQNKVVCPVCGKQSPNTALFCANCGAKLETVGEAVADVAKDAAEAVKEAVEEVKEAVEDKTDD